MVGYTQYIIRYLFSSPHTAMCHYCLLMTIYDVTFYRCGIFSVCNCLRKGVGAKLYVVSFSFFVDTGVSACEFAGALWTVWAASVRDWQLRLYANQTTNCEASFLYSHIPKKTFWTNRKPLMESVQLVLPSSFFVPLGLWQHQDSSESFSEMLSVAPTHKHRSFKALMFAHTCASHASLWLL